MTDDATNELRQLIDDYRRDVIEPFESIGGDSLLIAVLRHAAHVKFMETRGIKASELPNYVRVALGIEAV